MTNTGDFRRYSVAGDVNVAIDKYFSASRSSAAPEYEPEDKPDYGIKVKGIGRRKSKKELVREQREAAARAAVILVTAVLVVAMVAGALSTMAKKHELTKQIESAERTLSTSQSEYVRMSTKLDSLVSMSMIDEYAVNKLGMCKVSNSQIRYIDVSQYKEEREAAAARLLKENK